MYQDTDTLSLNIFHHHNLPGRKKWLPIKISPKQTVFDLKQVLRELNSQDGYVSVSPIKLRSYLFCFFCSIVNALSNNQFVLFWVVCNAAGFKKSFVMEKYMMMKL